MIVNFVKNQNIKSEEDNMESIQRKYWSQWEKVSILKYKGLIRVYRAYKVVLILFT